MASRYGNAANDHLYWQENLKTFYGVKVTLLISTAIYLILGAIIYDREKDLYWICNNGPVFNTDHTGNRIKALMVCLIIYHAVDTLQQLVDIVTVRSHSSHGPLRAILKLNGCYGLAIFIFLCVMYWTDDGETCRKYFLDYDNVYYRDNELRHFLTGRFLTAEIVFFFVIYILSCLFGGFGANKAYHHHGHDTHH